MIVIDVVPKDVHFLIDLSGSDIRSFKIILDNMEFKCDAENPDHVKADKFLHSSLYPVVKQLAESDAMVQAKEYTK